MAFSLRDLAPYVVPGINAGLALLSNNSANKNQNTADDRYNEIENLRMGLALKNDARGDQLMDRYTNTFQPLQDKVIDLARRPINPDVEAGRAGSDVEQAVAVQQGSLARAYGRMGVNPNDGAAIDAQSRLNLNAGLGRAAAMTNARRSAKDIQMQRLLTAAQLGTSLPGNAAQFTNMGGSAISDILARRANALGDANQLSNASGNQLGSSIADLLGKVLDPNGALNKLFGAKPTTPSGITDVAQPDLVGLTTPMADAAGASIAGSLGGAAASPAPAGTIDVGPVETPAAAGGGSAIAPIAAGLGAAGIGAGLAGAGAAAPGLVSVGDLILPSLGSAAGAGAGAGAAVGGAVSGGGVATGGGLGGAVAGDAAAAAPATSASAGLGGAAGSILNTLVPLAGVGGVVAGLVDTIKNESPNKGTFDPTTGAFNFVTVNAQINPHGGYMSPFYQSGQSLDQINKNAISFLQPFAQPYLQEYAKTGDWKAIRDTIPVPAGWKKGDDAVQKAKTKEQYAYAWLYGLTGGKHDPLDEIDKALGR